MPTGDSTVKILINKLMWTIDKQMDSFKFNFQMKILDNWSVP